MGFGGGAPAQSVSEPVFLGWKQMGRFMRPSLMRDYLHPYEMDDQSRMLLQQLMDQVRGRTSEARQALLSTMPEGAERSPIFAKLLSQIESEATRAGIGAILPTLTQRKEAAARILAPWVTGLTGQQTISTGPSPEDPLSTILGGILGGALQAAKIAIPHLAGIL